MTYPVLHSETLYTGKIFTVLQEEVQAPDGHVMHLDIVKHGGAVAFVPVDSQGRVLLVRQYRHPAGQELLEIPAGTLEPGEDPDACVVRECREETGMKPAVVQHLGGAFLAPGYSSEYLHFYRASELTPAPLDPDEDEDLSVVAMTLEDMRAAVRSGDIVDGKTIAVLALLDLQA